MQTGETPAAEAVASEVKLVEVPGSLPEHHQLADAQSIVQVLKLVREAGSDAPVVADWRRTVNLGVDQKRHYYALDMMAAE